MRTVTSTPSLPTPAINQAEHPTAVDRFLALVDQARAAVHAALAADAAARVRRAEASQTAPSDDADETARADDAAVPPTQLEQVVSGLLSGNHATPATIQVAG